MVSLLPYLHAANIPREDFKRDWPTKHTEIADLLCRWWKEGGTITTGEWEVYWQTIGRVTLALHT